MSKSDPIDQALKKAAEDGERIKLALAPHRALSNLVMAMQPPAYLLEIQRLANAMQPPAYLTAIDEMMATIKREQHLFEQLASPPHIFEDLTRQVDRMGALSESIIAPHRAFQEMMRSQTLVFEALSGRIAELNAIKFSIPQLSQATLAWNAAAIGLAERLNSIGLLSQRAMLSTRLFEGPGVYAKFVRHTTDLLAADPAADVAMRLRGSLNLAGHQLLDIADAVSAFVAIPEDDEEPDEVRVLNAPFAQQEELLKCRYIGDEDDTAALTAASLAAQITQQGRRILELVTQCNEAGRTSALNQEVFKPTTRLMTVFSDLPWLSATDRLRFGVVLDCLYFIFYEGAGADHLRFLDKNGGPLTDTDCRFIWCVKHLRNDWSRHDADHGKEKEIQQSWSELAEEFRWLGLDKHPTDARHFQQLHHRLFILAEDFLQRILNKLTLKA